MEPSRPTRSANVPVDSVVEMIVLGLVVYVLAIGVMVFVVVVVMVFVAIVVKVFLVMTTVALVMAANGRCAYHWAVENIVEL
jgi:hypothetical protein